jgi:AcrR family transcriptional regulator
MSRRQTDRSEATRGELLRIARDLFTDPGYEKTSLDVIASRAGVTKGAIYHHFPNKRDLFQAVFEVLEQEIVEKVIMAAHGAGDDVWAGLQLGTGAFLEAARDTAVARIVLIDGPSVLGWETWREIDDRYGFALTRGSLEAAMGAGLIAEQPLDPLAHIFLAALSEAALQIARADDTEKAIEEMTGAITTLMESMRKK